MITILGPTASGKTSLAVATACAINAEIISADSRQVYRRMDIGTGKDLAEYAVNGSIVPHHLINICEPGEKYNLFRFQHDFHTAYDNIRSRGKRPVLCGGSGLYLEAALKGYSLPEVPANHSLREELKGKTISELADILSTYKTPHNTTDVDTPQRAIRAIEIEEYIKARPTASQDYPPTPSIVIGIQIDREQRRQRIGQRLRERLEAGMVDEARRLMDSGLTADDLIYYGLEYKFLALHITNRISLAEMTVQLETAICQFAKRQMTWFRGMERRGIPIRWLDALLPLEDKVRIIQNILKQTNHD
ncbi:MAG: tRNA (adenosine(37)-N6)-dimethylallyltransferase MiaA [Tannerellaceae bacterium]|nr:tRNA (adenosine(37)-N6)-dimethylallyltransferase MiaA [Tannerellaceae bacterium]